MGKQKAGGGYELITPGTDTRGQNYIDEYKLKLDQLEAQKKRDEALKQHLSNYAKDPVSQGLAAAEFEMKERDAAKKAAEAEHDRVAREAKDKYPDDPYAQASHIAMKYVRERTAPEAKKAFGEGERLTQMKEQEKIARGLENIPVIGQFAPTREIVGAAVETVPRMASLLARVTDQVTGENAADEANREAQKIGQAREIAREEDLSPYLSRQFGGAAQSLMQMAGTPGGATSKIVGAGLLSGNEALTTAEDAGLTGAAKLRYAGTQGLLEAGIAMLGQKIFGGGIESRLAGQSVAAQTWKQLAKNIGTDALQEMPEEVVTAILQDLSSKFEGVSPDMSFGDFVANATDAAVQAAMMAPMANSGNIARLALQRKKLPEKPTEQPTPPDAPEQQQAQAQAAMSMFPDLQDLVRNNPEQAPAFEAEALRRVQEQQAQDQQQTQAGTAPPSTAPQDPAPLEPATQSYLNTPEVQAFLNKPESKRAYEDAIKAGMPAIDNPNRDGRWKYATKLREQAAQAQTQVPAQQSLPAQPQVELAPVSPELAPPEMFEQFMRDDLAQIPPAAQPEQAATPAVQPEQTQRTREEFESEYMDLRNKVKQTSGPDDPAARPLIEKLRDLYDENPDLANEIDDREMNAPQKSKMDQFLDYSGQGVPPENQESFRKLMSEAVQRSADLSVDMGEYAVFGNPDDPKVSTKIDAVRDYLTSKGHEVGPATFNDKAGTVTMPVKKGASPIATGGPSPDQSQPTEAGPVSYSSGLSRSPAEIDESIKAGNPVGVSAFNNLSAPIRKKLVDYANSDGRVFIDSGAFTAFTKSKEVDWDGVLFAYHEMVSSVAPEKRSNITIVAPDIVGNHDATMQLQADLVDKFTPFLNSGATVILPVQRGGHGSIAGNFADLTNTFDEKTMDGVTIGVPFNAKAWSQDDVLDFMRFRDQNDPGRKFHLLGGGPSKIKSLIEAAEAEGLSTEGISGDALPQKISKRKKGAKPAATPAGEPPKWKLNDKVKIQSTGENGSIMTIQKKDDGWQALVGIEAGGSKWVKTDDLAPSNFKDGVDKIVDALSGNKPRRGEVGMMMSSGEVVETSSGRQTTPFPKVNVKTDRGTAATLKKVEAWLQENAVAEAESRGDEFNALQFKNETPGKIPPASKDSMEEYLFGEQPKVPQSILKPLLPVIDVLDNPNPSYQALIDKEKKQYDEAKAALEAEGIDPSGLEELVQNSKEEGFHAGQNDGSPTLTDEQADRLIDLSINTGADEVRAGDIVEYTVRGEKARGLVEKRRSDGSIHVATERTKDKHGRRISTRYSENVLLKVGDFTKVGTSNFPSTLEKFYAEWKDKNEDQVTAEFAKLWDSLDSDDKGRFADRLRKFGIPGAKSNSSTKTLSESVANLIVRSKEIPGKLRQLYDITMEYPDLSDGGGTPEQVDEFLSRIYEVDLSLPPQDRAALLVEDMRRDVLYGYAARQFGEDVAKAMFDDIDEPAAEKPADTDIEALVRAEIARQEAEDAAKSKPEEKPESEPELTVDEAIKDLEDAKNEDIGNRKPWKADKTFWSIFDAGIDDAIRKGKYLQYSTGLDDNITKADLNLARVLLKEKGYKTGKVVFNEETSSVEMEVMPLKPVKTGWDAVPGHFAEKLLTGARYRSITDARKEAAEIIGKPIKSGTPEAKQLDEAIEYGVVQAGRQIVEQGGTEAEIFDKLVDLYQRHPVLGVRDSISMIMQAYSTPVPLAYLASRLSGMTKDSTVWEPTAGNGMLLIEATPENVQANELDEDRAAVLKDQGFKVTEFDATTHKAPKVDIVLANPPFGTDKDALGQTIKFDVDGFKTTERDHAIVLQSLKGLKEDGTAVLIIAAKGHNAKTDRERRLDYAQGTGRPFYDALYQGYDVVSHFTVSGSLYSRQGASFPVDVIVIRPPGTVPVERKRSTPWAIMPRTFKTWQEIKDAFIVARSGESGTGVPSGTGINRNPDLPTGTGSDVGGLSGENADSPEVATGELGTPESEPAVSPDVAGESGAGSGRAKKPRKPRKEPGVPKPPGSKRGGKGDVSDPTAGTTKGGKGLDSGNRPGGVAGDVSTGTRDVRKDISDNARKSFNDFLDGLAGTPFGSGLPITPELIAKTVRMVRDQIIDKVTKFSDLVARVVNMSSRAVAQKLAPLLEAAWKILGETNSELDAVTPVEQLLNPKKEEMTGTDHQSPYESASKNKRVETLIPTNLAAATTRALEAIEETYGPVDDFVRRELGYKEGDPFFDDMSAEQVDAIAMAIHSHKVGAGMICGDMTGVGKGRVAAALMRYAQQQNLVPLFVTEKPDLFGDIYRDLIDIGSDTAAKPFNALTTNDTSGSSAIKLPNGRKLQMDKEDSETFFRQALESVKSGKGFKTKDGQKIDAVFTMYSQLQTVKGRETSRRELIRELMPHAFLIMDESHNAGGTPKTGWKSKDAPPDRAQYAREIVQSAQGVMYLSATFAKRPDVMTLYSKTDMVKAVDGNLDALTSTVKAGGLPLQQVLSSMLAEVGQYIRREKSFNGIEFQKVDVNVDLGEQDKITHVFREIRSLDDVMAEIVSQLNDVLVDAGESAVAGDVATGDAGMTSTSFSTILWNAVDQMLFALKADQAADEAIKSWKAGETPILAVDNTMETIIDEYVAERGIKEGEVVDLTFRDILHRYLERSRWITIDTGLRDAKNKKITRKVRLTDEQLNVETDKGNGLELFKAAFNIIEGIDIKAPASPIDWIRYRLEKAGMSAAEITGRKTMLQYSDDGKARLTKRPRKERGTTGKQAVIADVNSGDLDGLLLNRSGATGVSIHASEKFKNQRIRHMIIVQPAKNIDEFMQMLGRVNRTGQVVKPRYSLLMSDSPSELRPAAVLSKKLASLNASVTAKSKGAVGFEVTDVMNQVGGLVLLQYLKENQELAMELDMLDPSMEQQDENDVPTEAEQLEAAIRIATGRAAILPIDRQRVFWEDLTALYEAKIEQLNALNENPLIAQTMDFGAKTLTSMTIFPGKENEGPFAAAAILSRMDVKNLGKPLKPEEVFQRLKDFYEITDLSKLEDAAELWKANVSDALSREAQKFNDEYFSRWVNEDAIAAGKQRTETQLNNLIMTMDLYPPGTIVNFGSLTGVVTSFKRTGKNGSPVAPSRWIIELAVNDPAKILRVPVSQVTEISAARNQSIDDALVEFQMMQSDAREKRWIGTGNLVAGFSKLQNGNGKFIFYTDDQGVAQRGILMPRQFNAAAFLENQPVEFKNPEDILTFFDQRGGRVVSPDGGLIVTMVSRTLSLVSWKAKSRGGKYTTNKGIREAAGAEFNSSGNQMILPAGESREKKLKVLAAALKVTPLLAMETDARRLAREILGDKLPSNAELASGTTMEELDAKRAAAEKARQELKALKDQAAKYDADIAKGFQKGLEGAGAFGGNILTPEMLKAIGGRMAVTIQMGIKQFEVFVRDLRVNHPDAPMDMIRDTLIRMWNNYREQFGLDKASSAAFDKAIQSVEDEIIEKAVQEAAEPPQPATTAEDEETPAGGKLYSTMNEFSAMQREELGMPERTLPITESREDSVDLAKQVAETKEGSKRIDDLILELSSRPRTVTPFENDLLNYRNAELGNRLDAALRQRIEAKANNDDMMTSVSETMSENLMALKKQLILILEEIGTAAGRALQARKAIIDQDYTLDRLSLVYEATHGKAPSTAVLAELQSKIDDLKKTVETLEQMNKEQEAKINDLQTKLVEAHDAAVAESTQGPAFIPSPEPEPAKPGIIEKIAADARVRVDKAYSNIMDLLKGNTAFSEMGAVAKMTEALTQLAIGYTEMGVVRLADFLSRVKKRLGPEADKIRDLAIDAWNSVHMNSLDRAVQNITKNLDITDPESIGKVARDLHRFVIQRDALDASPAGRESAVDAVHEIMKDFIPGVDRGDIARAMSGIGVFAQLNKDQIEAIRRDQKAQLLLLEQIKDWKKGVAPPATGQERPPVSDEQRLLRRLANEAKKEAGMIMGRKGQLRSALDAAIRATRNRIADLDKALREGAPIPRNEKILKDDGSPEFQKLTSLRAQRDELQAQYDTMFGKRELTDEQRISIAEKALDRAIAGLEADLAIGKLYDDDPRTPVTSPAIEAKRAQLAALKANRDEMRLLSGEEQARSDAAYERRLLERDAELARRLAENDFAPKPKKPARVMTPRMLELGLSIQKKRAELDQLQKDWEFSRKHIVYKVAVAGPLAAGATLRKAATVFDQSMIGRQGQLLGLANLADYSEAIKAAFENPLKEGTIFTTEQSLFNLQSELDSDTNAVRLEQIGRLVVTDVHGGIKKAEEGYTKTTLLDKIPGVLGSERAGIAFINTLRRLVFRSLVEKLAKRMDGKQRISDADLRVIGNFVNVFSGRGSVLGFERAADAMSAVFFSPRWWASRLQILAFQPLWAESQWVGGEGASTEVRAMLAKEFIKQAAAQFIVIGFAAAGLAAAFGAPGDDEEWDIYYDPRHADFGKLRIGNTIVDMSAGLGQHVSFLARIMTGTDIRRWKTQDTDTGRVVMSYLRGKLAPLPGAVADILSKNKTNIAGDEVFGWDWFVSKTAPLILQDIKKTFENESIPVATVLSLMTFFGVAGQSREDRVEERADLANQIRAKKNQGRDADLPAIIDAHLKEAAIDEARQKLRTADPEDTERLEKIIAGDEGEISDAIEKEKGDLILRAAEMLSSEDRKNKRSSKEDEAIEQARVIMKEIAPTFEDADRLFREAYKRKYGMLVEVSGSQFKPKKSVISARMRLKQIYGIGPNR